MLFPLCFQRFLELSMNFGANTTPFQLVTAFVICSGIKAVLTKLGAAFSGKRSLNSLDVDMNVTEC